MAPERKQYEGHSIEVREREGKRELLIDGKPVRYGELPGGRYFLDEYAYEWTDDLMELAQRYLDHQRRAAEVRRERGASPRRK